MSYNVVESTNNIQNNITSDIPFNITNQETENAMNQIIEQINEANTSKNYFQVDIQFIDYNKNQIKKLTEIFNKCSFNIGLSLKIDFQELSKNYWKNYEELILSLPKNSTLMIYLVSDTDIPKEQFKSFIQCINFKKNINSLSFENWRFWKWSSKDFGEMIQILSTYSKGKLFSYLPVNFGFGLSNEIMKKEAIEWNDDKKTDYLEVFMLRESLSNTQIVGNYNQLKMVSLELLPFKLDSDGYKKLILDFLQKFPHREERVHYWLEQSDLSTFVDFKKIMAEILFKFYERIENANIYDLKLNPFLEQDKYIEKLIVLANKNIDKFSLLHTYKINFSDLNLEHVKRLITFLHKTELKNVHNIHIDSGNINESIPFENFLYFLKKQETNISCWYLKGPFGKLSIENLLSLMQVFKKTNARVLNFENIGLDKLDDDEFLKFFACILENSIQDWHLSFNNNSISKRNHIILEKIYDLKLKSELENITLWNEFEVLETSNHEKWNKEKIEIFTKLIMKLHAEGHYYSQRACYGLINNEQEFLLIKEFLQYQIKKVDKLKISKAINKSIHWVCGNHWLGENQSERPFDYKQRHELAQLCFQNIEFAPFFQVKQFKLEAKDVLPIFLLNLEHMGHETIINIKKFYDLFDSNLPIKDFINVWKHLEEIIPNIEHAWEIDLEDADYSIVKEVIQQKIVPGLKKATLEFYKDLKFYQAILHKIEHFKFEEGEMHDMSKWLLLLQWYSWLMIKLHSFPKEVIKDVNLGKILKETVDLADPLLRYTVIKTLISNLKEYDETQKIYQTLTAKNKPYTVVPALFLTRMIHSDPKNAAENYELALDLFNNLSGNYNLSLYARALTCALEAITTIGNLSVKQKLSLLKDLTQRNENVLKFESKLKDYFYKARTNQKIIASSKIMESINKILGDEISNAIIQLLPAKYKTKFDRAEDINAEDIIGLSRNIIAETIKITHDTELANQMANWFLIQGLCMLQELNVLIDVPIHQYKPSINNLFKKLFHLEDQQMQYYKTVFGGKRNEESIFVYLAKLRTLTTKDSEIANKFYDFIKNVLSKESQEFYHARYNLDNNAQLALIFKYNPKLIKFWKTNQTVDFNDFVIKNKIDEKIIDIDFAQFFYSKIFLHHHFPLKDCPELKSYLEISDPKTRAEIKFRLEKEIKEGADKNNKHNEKINANDNLSQDKSKLNRLIQLSIINLIECAKQDTKFQMACIRQIILYNQLYSYKYELYNDLRSLKKTLTTNQHKLDLNRTKNFKIVFTDNYWDLFMVGTDVDGSCQRVNGDPSLNKCLMAYVMDGKNKMLAIQDNNGKTVSRCILRLLIDDETNKPILFMEELYPYFLTFTQKESLEVFAKMIASDLNLCLVSSESTINSKKYPNHLKSISGIGPEYVDAIHTIAEDGIFTIKNSQILFNPIDIISDEIMKSFPSFKAEDHCLKILDIIHNYADFDRVISNGKIIQPTLHFKWPEISKEKRFEQLEVNNQNESTKEKLNI